MSRRVLRFEGWSDILSLDLRGSPLFLESDFGRLAGKTIGAEIHSSRLPSSGSTRTAH